MLGGTAYGQLSMSDDSSTLKKGTAFTEVEVDSILSKLLQGRHAQQRLALATDAIAKADTLIFTLKSSNLNLRNSLLNQEEYNEYQKKLYVNKVAKAKKDGVILSIKIGAIGVGVGLLIAAAFF